MKSLTTAFSHINLERKSDSLSDKEWAKPFSLDEILKSRPKKVRTYDDLVKHVAQILYRHRNLTLFYRGQSQDHKNEDGGSTILPSIYRKGKGETRLLLKDRFRQLTECVQQLRTLFADQQIKLAGTSFINKYPEIGWSILQHYEVCPTPLIDITHSLHVACSFAFDRNRGKTGVIYVLGMPWSTHAIGYNTYEELVNIRLLSVCPPQAQRPFFQEGYLAGPFPNYRLDDTSRVEQFDLARRVITKFEIPINDDFLGEGFVRIPSKRLYQRVDAVKDICDHIKLLDKVTKPN